MNAKKITAILIGIILIIVASVLLGRCKSCNQEPVKPVVVTPEQIQTVYSPLYDELEKANEQLKRSNDSLTKANQALSKKVATAKSSKQKAAVNVSLAEQKKDTASLVAALKEEVAESENLILVQDEQLNIQSEIIQTNERVITNLERENSLQKQQINTLATNSNTQAGMLATAEKNAEKNGKKVNRRGKIILGLIGLAVIEGIIISLSNR